MKKEFELIEAIIKNLNLEFAQKYKDFRGIFLFGSYARKDYNKYSDYDLFIVFDEPKIWKIKDELKYRIYDYEIENLIKIDAHFGVTNDLNNPVTPFYENIKKEGIFYEKGR
ncbi:MAG: nucleotidyltransferase domain-containing protein [FCB group bacterium]